MLSPGGAFLLVVPGVFRGKPPSSLSFALSIGASPGFAVCCNRDSMSCLCCSRTEILRCNCSLIVGSCVTNPGERQASPTSWIPRPPVSMPLEVRLPAEGRAFEVDVFFERSSMRGRCLEVGRSGEAPGSFFTMIFGGTPFRDLWLSCQRGACCGEGTMPIIKEYEIRTSWASSCQPSWPLGCGSGAASPRHLACSSPTPPALAASWARPQEEYRRRRCGRAVRATAPWRWRRSWWTRL